MSTDNEPIPDIWYRNLEDDRTFVVTSVDETDDVVEIQDYEGDLDELTLAEWFALDLEVTAAPENWSGAMDRVDDEDLDDGEAAARHPGGRAAEPDID
jgi:hypothetical protein